MSHQFGLVILMILCLFIHVSLTISYTFGIDFESTLKYANSTSQIDITYLQRLYDATNGPFWVYPFHITNTSARWNFTEQPVNPCGGWQGVYCDLSLSPSRVIVLLLDKYNLSGTIPRGISNLTHLIDLGLQNNHLKGSVPHELCQLNLLAFLDLGLNHFTGNVPSCLFQNTSSQLSYLSLSANHLHGHLPNVTSPINLTYLNLENNYLSGTFPESWKTNMSYLETLYLAKNRLVGEIDYLSSITELRYLGLSQNDFTGYLPDSLGKLMNLRALYFHENYFRGSIPESWSNFTYMYYFSIYENLITGTLPANLSNWKRTVVFTLDDNFISGSLPASLSSMREAQQFSVYSNVLTGTIPPSYAKLENLQLYLLQQNLFTGSLEQVFNTSAQKYLQTIDVSMNAFTGRIPTQIFTDSLSSFSAFKTCFDGSIPVEICNANNLETLVLDGITSYCARNIWPGIADSPQYASPVKRGAPDCIWYLPKITTLHLSSNDLEGTIPSLPAYGNLTNLDLSFNRFVGTIPQSLQNWTKLMNLNLKNNRLVGEITGMGELKYTRTANEQGITLSLSNNRLSGMIPIQLLHALNLDIVDGNLFTCTSEHQPPYSDPNSADYVCASNMLDISLYCFLSASIFVTLCLVVGLFLFYRHFPRPSATKPPIDDHIEDRNTSAHTLPEQEAVIIQMEIDRLANRPSICSYLYTLYIYHNNALFLTRMHTHFTATNTSTDAFIRMLLSILYWRCIVKETRENTNSAYSRRHVFLTQFLRSVKVLRQITLYLCLFVVIVTIPVYDILKHDYGTYSNQYRWLISGAFFSGYPPAIAILLIWFVTLGCTVYLIDRDIPPLTSDATDARTNSTRSSLSYWANFRFNSSETSSSFQSSSSGSPDHGGQRPRDLSSSSTKASTQDSGNNSNTSSKQSRSALRQTIYQATQTLTTTVKTSADYWRKPSVWISIIALFLNIIVVIAIKAGFIYLLISAQTIFSFKILIEIALAAVDLTWSAILVPIIVNRLPNKRATGRMLLKTSMLYFNSIFAPCIVIAVVDTSCFNGLFVKAGQVEEDFRIEYCYLLDVNDPLQCSEYRYFTTTRYYTPLFIYNYDCYSTIITNYIPIFLISYTTLTMIVPLVSLLVISREKPWSIFQILPGIYKADSIHDNDPWLSNVHDSNESTPYAREHTTDDNHNATLNHMHQVQHRQHHHAPEESTSPTLPTERMNSTATATEGWTLYSSRANSTAPTLSIEASTSDSTATSTTAEQQQNANPFRSRSVFFPAFILASATHHLLVLLTFGLLCPALAVSVAVVVCATTLTWEVVIGRWMTTGLVSSQFVSCTQLSEARLQQLDEVCENVCTSPRKSIWILSFGSGIFFAFVLLDMAGDQQGWYYALWAPITVLILALVVWLWYVGVTQTSRTVLLQPRPQLSFRSSRSSSQKESFVDNDFPANYDNYAATAALNKSSSATNSTSDGEPNARSRFLSRLLSSVRTSSTNSVNNTSRTNNNSTGAKRTLSTVELAVKLPHLSEEDD